jgi:hypothetical protein
VTCVEFLGLSPFRFGEVVMMTAAGKFRLELEALGSSAAHVTAQGENLATTHLSSNNRLVAAQPGWVGSSG